MIYRQEWYQSPKRKTTTTTTTRLILFSVLLLSITFCPSFVASAAASSSSSSINDDEKENISSSSSSASSKHQILKPWQECNVFMAPTSSMGWGVFAARSFEVGEIVDMAKLILPFDKKSQQIQNTALDDYVYGYYRIDYNARKLLEMHTVMFGMEMIYNHDPGDANLEYVTFSREPAPDVPNSSNAIGFVARRPIKAGEQLCSTYGGMDDTMPGRSSSSSSSSSSSNWWSQRQHMQMQHITNKDDRRLSKEKLVQYQTEFCSKIHAGIGLPTWKERIEPILPPSYQLPFWMDAKRVLVPIADAGIGNAMAKVDIMTIDERIEITTGLIVSRKIMEGTSLAAIMISFDDLDERNQNVLKQLHQSGQYIMQYQGVDTDWKTVDLLTRKGQEDQDPNDNERPSSLSSASSYKDLAILPIGGGLGLVRRVGVSSSSDSTATTADAAIVPNCRLKIHGITDDEDDDNDTNTDTKINIEKQVLVKGSKVGVTLELISTKTIKMGEKLLLDLPPAGSIREREKLRKEVELTGMPIAKDLYGNEEGKNKKRTNNHRRNNEL